MTISQHQKNVFLSELKEKWGKSIVRQYGWESYGHNPLRKIVSCARIWGDFQEFAKHARAMQVVKHRKAVAEKQPLNHCISEKPRLTTKTIDALLKLAQYNRAEEFGQVFTTETADEMESDIMLWTTDPKGENVRVGGTTLHKQMGYVSKQYLLAADQNGLLHRRPKTAGNVDPLPQAIEDDTAPSPLSSEGGREVLVPTSNTNDVERIVTSPDSWSCFSGSTLSSLPSASTRSSLTSDNSQPKCYRH